LRNFAGSEILAQRRETWRHDAREGERAFSLCEESEAATIESLPLKGRSESEARSGERIGASAPLEPQERSHSMKPRGRQRVMHPEIVQITIKAEEAELSPSAVREPELRGERSSLGRRIGTARENPARTALIASLLPPCLSAARLAVTCTPEERAPCSQERGALL
jgi:hypothetical protein